MQGRDSIEQEIGENAIREHVITTQADLQSPKFFMTKELQEIIGESTPPSNDDGAEDVEQSQLENLHQLLEIALQNEEKAKQAVEEMTAQLEASEAARKDMQLQLEKVKYQSNLIIQAQQTTIETLNKRRDAAMSSTVNLIKERDRAVCNQTEERLLNNKLQLSLEEAQNKFAQLKAEYEKELFNQTNEIVKLKKIIFKQAKAMEQNEKCNPPNVQFGRLFQDTDRNMDMLLPVNNLPGQIRRR